jgi:hypothetical protein
MIVESYEDVIYLSGALRDNFWDTVHTAISLTLKRHSSGVIIDCSQITECTPQGAETFRDVLSFIQEHDARVICIGVPNNVMEVLKSTPDVRSQLPLAGSLDEARRSLDLLPPVAARPKTKRELRNGGTEARPKIVLYLTGDGRDQQGLAAAKRMADGLKAEVIPVFVIVVPRELPLQAPMKECEVIALRAISGAGKFFKEHHVPYRVVLERGRDVATALESVITENKAGNLLIPLSADPNRVDEELKLIKTALSKVSAQVAFIRGKLEKEPAAV